MRFISELLSLVFFFLLVRSVFSAVWRLLRGGASIPNPGYHPQEQPRGEMQSAGELRKDPVCGTFVATSTAFTKAVSGTTAYFCSAACRDRYRPDQSARNRWEKDTAVRN